MTPEIERCLNDPGHTPPLAALPGILSALGALPEDQAETVERALARAGTAAGRAALDQLSGAAPLARQRLLAVVKRVASAGGADALGPGLLAALGDPDPKCRRLAARALGVLGSPEAEPALIAALGREALPEQRAIVEALGKLGGPDALGALDALDLSDADLAKRAARARLLIERRLRRGVEHGIALDRPLGRAARLAASCRSGLSELLQQELAAFGARAVSPTRVELAHSGSLEQLLVARTALELALAVSLDTSPREDLAERVARALTRSETLALLHAWTRGVPRVRLTWATGGHRRALTWRIAEKLRPHADALVNDPRGASWTARVDPERGELLLLPRLDPDPRFDYRAADVPGASHPTIAAALARTAQARPTDVVWDPFVGSGLELVERARLGPFERLIGSDLDLRALSAAEKNLKSAHVTRFELVHGDARVLSPRGVNLILTNPPMGRRVVRDGTVGALLEGFVAHAATVLPRGGRLVWLSPAERRTARAAQAAGFHVERGPDVDMGGFFARVQLLTRR